MKKFFKWTAFLVIAVILVAVIAVCYITLALPNVGKAEDIKIAATPERIARGKYLANHVVMCVDCHSRRDWTKFAGPTDTAHLGIGGDKFDTTVGFPGEVSVPNITPTNLKDWTDGELFRAITTGVKKDNTPIFPLMPWPFFSKLDREDIYSVIAYIRTLKPENTSYPKAKLDFPLNIIVHTIPQKATLGKRPDTTDMVKYGEYMVQSAACRECHTQDDQGKPLPGLDFAGGKKFMLLGNTLSTANLTPDKETGIGNWTKEDFLNRFRRFRDRSNTINVNPKTEFQTIMPWYNYAGMTDTDLSAIYAYLRTIKPVKNKVTKYVVNSTALASN
jgi:mono/diheme cytochrome c family protein